MTTHTPKVLWFIAFAPMVPLLAAPDAPDFNREVRPILSNYCFKCHGPDDKARKSKLRLDVREEALKPAKSGDHAIVPGKVDESELVTRIFSKDDVNELLQQAAGFDLHPVGDLQFDATERPIFCAGKDYSFAWMARLSAVALCSRMDSFTCGVMMRWACR